MYLSYVFLSIAFVVFGVPANGSSIEEQFEANEVVPDVIPVAPAALARVKYPSGANVNLGNELTPTQVKDEPRVAWNARPNKFYTLAFVDPDAPSRADPQLREFKHWIVGNIRGSDRSSGDVLAEYIGAGPGEDSGFHRYVFLVYEQPTKLTFEGPRLNNTSIYNRTEFSISNFAENYNLIGPVAGNFFQAEYDDYVPILHDQIGLS